MNTNNDELRLVLAGRPIDGAWHQVHRYCGVPWGDDNPPETWAFRYFDAIETDPDEVSAQDVVCASALHPGLSREDLAFFWDNRKRLNEWLSELPEDNPGPVSLENANETVVSVLGELPSLAEGVSLTLLSKVMHRKRPWMIPMLDREVIDRYRPLTGERRPNEAWSPLLDRLREDLETNREYLASLGLVLRVLHERQVSRLRIADIAIWMDGRHD